MSLLERIPARDASSELHHLLRQATKRPHHALDHHPLMAPLVRQDLTVEQYGQAISALHGIYAAAESGILGFLDGHTGLFDYQARRKLPALESDLVALGRLPAMAPAVLLPPGSLGALVGVLYTIEGSEQGGKVIARLLRQIPCLSLPTAFFDGYGDLSRQRWQEFLQFAKTQCIGEHQAIAVETAVSTFEAFKTHFDACLPQLSSYPHPDA